MFCNGVELCMPGETGADARGCVPALASPCSASQRCDEAAELCTTVCAVAFDGDGDGHDTIECGGTDCDDADRNRYPGNAEVCDPAHHDEDCDPFTFGVRDSDGDGFADARCCNLDGGSMRCGDDCDDTRAGAHPGLAETCDLFDNDCDGFVDEGVLLTFYRDSDGDGFGVETDMVQACARPMGYALIAGDCDDTRGGVNPGVPERCDRPPEGAEPVDEDCDGVANPAALCACLEGETTGCMLPGRCGAGSVTCVGGEWSDACSIAPALELCNGEDDDCDGLVDEGVSITTCYGDPDRDGYSTAAAEVTTTCGPCGVGTTDRAPIGSDTDCREGDVRSYPGASELCDGIDNDCSSGGGAEPSEDADGDGHASTSAACAGRTFPRDDCQDANAEV